jgi:hypothetical protein
MSTPNEPQDPYASGDKPEQPGGPVPQPPATPPPYGAGPAQPGYPAQSGYPAAPQYGATPYPAAPQYGATPYPAAPQYGGASFTPPPRNYLVWAILTTVLCCLPLGIVSIVFSAQVNSKWAAGDFAGAQGSAAKAKSFAIWSAVVGAVLVVVYIGLLVAGVISSRSFNTTY